MKRFDTKTYTGKDREFIRVAPGIQQIYGWHKGQGCYLSGGFRVRKTIDGKTIQKVLPTKIKARQYLADISKGVYEIPVADDTSITFTDLWDQFHTSDTYKADLAESTQLSYPRQWKLAWFDPLRDKDVKRTTSKDLDGWIEWMGSNIHMLSKQKTNFKRELDLLGSMMTYYCEYVEESHTSPIKSRHRDDVYNYMPDEESQSVVKIIYMDEPTFRRWLICLRRQEHGEVLYILAQFQYYHALRVSEAAVIKGSNFDFEKKEITFNEHMIYLSKMGRKDKVVPGLKNRKKSRRKNRRKQPKLLSKTHPIMPGYLEDLTNFRWTDDYLFARNGQHLTYRSIQNSYNNAHREMGFPEVSTHIVRKSGSSDVYRRTGGSEVAAKEILGNDAVLDPYIITSSGLLNKLSEERFADQPVAAELIDLLSQSCHRHVNN